MERVSSDEANGKHRVAVIGAGSTGSSWAGLFAAHGLSVTLYDARPEAAAMGLDRARRAARFLAARGLADRERVAEGLSQIRHESALQGAVDGVFLVQEAVTDDLSVKKGLFASVSRLTDDDTLIATSTSGLSISAIQQDAHLPGRTLAAHPYNPPHLIPLVEIAAGRMTTAGSIEAASAFYRGLGKEVVLLRDDVPGYIANRLSAALWREAVDLVLTGVATVEEVDRAVRTGPGLRWAAMGPHLVYHLGGGPGGIRGHLAHLTGTKEAMLRDLATWTSFPAETADVLANGLAPEIGDRSIDELEELRDETLAALLDALRHVNGPPEG